MTKHITTQGIITILNRHGWELDASDAADCEFAARVAEALSNDDLPSLTSIIAGGGISEEAEASARRIRATYLDALA